MPFLRTAAGIVSMMIAFAAFCEERQEFVQDCFAVAADGKDASSPVAHLSGRAPYFMLYDERGDLLEVVPNPYLDLEFGIGPRMATLLVEKKVTVLVAGMAGPKMEKVLKANNVRFVSRGGTVQDIANELKE